MQKLIKERLDDERAELDGIMYDALLQEGTEKRAIMIDGEKLGEVGWTFKKPEPIVTRHSEFSEDMNDAGIAQVTEQIDILQLPAEEIARLKKNYPQAIKYDWRVPNWESYYSQLDNGSTIFTPTGEVVGYIEWTNRTPLHIAVRTPKPARLLAKLTQEEIANMIEPVYVHPALAPALGLVEPPRAVS
jgi:hypothetical protein